MLESKLRRGGLHVARNENWVTDSSDTENNGEKKVKHYSRGSNLSKWMNG